MNPVVCGIVFPLILIHHLVGFYDQRFQIIRRLVRPYFSNRNMVLVVPHTLMQAFHLPAEFFLIAVPEHGDKFIPADAVHPWRIQRGVNHFKAILDQLIARAVSQRVVGLLEARDITVYNAHRAKLLKLVAVFKHSIAVVSAGERIMKAQRIQMAKQIPAAQQRHDEIADHLDQRADQHHHILIRVIHAEAAHHAVFNENRPRHQPGNILRL